MVGHKGIGGLLELLLQIKSRSFYLSWLNFGGLTAFENSLFSLSKWIFHRFFPNFVTNINWKYFPNVFSLPSSNFRDALVPNLALLKLVEK